MYLTPPAEHSNVGEWLQEKLSQIVDVHKVGCVQTGAQRYVHSNSINRENTQVKGFMAIWLNYKIKVKMLNATSPFLPICAMEQFLDY